MPYTIDHSYVHHANPWIPKTDNIRLDSKLTMRLAKKTCLAPPPLPKNLLKKYADIQNYVGYGYGCYGYGTIMVGM